MVDRWILIGWPMCSRWSTTTTHRSIASNVEGFQKCFREDSLKLLEGNIGQKAWKVFILHLKVISLWEEPSLWTYLEEESALSPRAEKERFSPHMKVVHRVWSLIYVEGGQRIVHDVQRLRGSIQVKASLSFIKHLKDFSKLFIVISL